MKSISIIAICLLSTTLHATPNREVRIQTDAFVFDTVEQRVIASNNVRISDSKMTIQANSAVFNSQKNTINIKGKVLAQQNDTTLRTSELIAVLESGNIIVPKKMAFKHSRYFGESNSAFYNSNTQILTLKGDPKITEGKNTLQADEISLNFKTNKVQSKGKTKITVSETTRIDSQQ